MNLKSPQISTEDGQSILLSMALIGSGTAVSLTVSLMVSESEQYFTPDTTMPEGRQSLESLRVMSWPDLVKDFAVHVNDSMPSPPKSKEPAPELYSFRVTVTVSVRPRAPPFPR